MIVVKRCRQALVTARPAKSGQSASLTNLNKRKQISFGLAVTAALGSCFSAQPASAQEVAIKVHFLCVTRDGDRNLEKFAEFDAYVNPTIPWDERIRPVRRAWDLYADRWGIVPHCMDSEFYRMQKQNWENIRAEIILDAEKKGARRMDWRPSQDVFAFLLRDSVPAPPPKPVGLIVSSSASPRQPQATQPAPSPPRAAPRSSAPFKPMPECKARKGASCGRPI